MNVRRLNHHPGEERLNDFIDGELTPGDRERVAAHLETCPACRREVAALRRLLDEAGGLPGEAAPGRDLWREIRGTIERAPAAAPAAAPEFRVVPGGFRLLRPLAIAAAVVLLVAASSLITALILDRSDRGRRSEYASGIEGGRAALTAYQSAETDYAEATRQLLAAYEARKSRLSPETVRIVEENLRIIDVALQKSRAALEADPGNRSLSDLTAAAYQKKVDFLRRTLSLSS